MAPEIYFRILLLALGRDYVATAFTLGDFFANGGKQIILNSLAQYGGYVGAQAVGNQFTPQILLPIISNTQLASKFLQIPGMPPVQERIATLAFTLGAGAAVTKTGDVPMNIAAGTLIAALSQYMGSCVNNGNIPFAYMHPKRMNLTLKQHIQMQILIIGGIVIIVCCIKAYISYCRYCLKLVKKLKSILNRKPTVMGQFIPIT